MALTNSSFMSFPPFVMSGFFWHWWVLWITKITSLLALHWSRVHETSIYTTYNLQACKTTNYTNSQVYNIKPYAHSPVYKFLHAVHIKVTRLLFPNFLISSRVMWEKRPLTWRKRLCIRQFTLQELNLQKRATLDWDPGNASLTVKCGVPQERQCRESKKEVGPFRK